MPERSQRGGPIASPLPPTVGAQSAAHWLAARGLGPVPPTERWHVEVALDVIDAPAPDEFDERLATRFHLNIYAEEWGVYFAHAGQASAIRVGSIASVHGRDQHGLLAITPPLNEIGRLLRNLERQHAVALQRRHAAVKTNLAGAEPAIRAWLAAL